MITQNLSDESFSLAPTSMVELYVLDVSPVIKNIEEEDKILRFYDGSAYEYQDIVWQGNTYTALPIRGVEFNYDSQRPSRPKMTIANFEGTVSRLLKRYGGIEGSIVTRKRTLLKFLDDANFPGGQNPYGTPDPNAGFEDDVYEINIKTAETPFGIEFELAAPNDLENTRFPSMQIFGSLCPFTYRGVGCNYAGLNLTDSNGNSLLNTFNRPKYWEDDKDGGYGVNDYVYFVSGTALKLFKALQANENVTPTGNPSDWQEVPVVEWSTGVAFNSGDISYFVNPTTNLRTYGKALQDHTSILPYSGFSNTRLWAKDVCDKTLRTCRRKFSDGPLSFGGFRGASQLPF